MDKATKPTKYDRIHIVGGKQRTLDSLIHNPPATAMKMTITPELAAEMLTYNTNNRPISKKTVQNYTAQIAAGEWRYTHVPMIFDDKFQMQDGQHRALGAVNSGCSFDTDVVFGADHRNFAFLDHGKRRVAGDIFAINHVPDAVHMAAITRFCVQYDLGRGVTDGGGNTLNLTNEKLYEYFAKHPDVAAGIHIHNKFKKHRWSTSSIMAGLYVICARHSRRDADRFFAILADGHGHDKTYDPAIVVRNKMIDIATTGTKMSRVMQVGWVLTAWARVRGGLSGRGMKFGLEDKAPRAR